MVKPGFGMSEFLDAMRRYGPAGVEIRIDQRRQLRRRFDGGIEFDAQFAQERQVRPEACRDDDPIDSRARRACRPAAPRPELHRAAGETRSTANGASMLSLPVIDRPLGGKSERAALGQLVVQPAAQQLLDPVAAKSPEDLGLRGPSSCSSISASATLMAE